MTSEKLKAQSEKLKLKIQNYKKITVVGLGESGLASALLLSAKGANASVTDNGDNEDIRKNAEFLAKKGINVEIGRHSKHFLKGTDILVVSPGVENSSLPIKYAEKNSTPIISELELGYLFCEGQIIAVTGTNGKSTVVSLLGEILKESKIPYNVCGNVGNPLSGEVEEITEDTKVVLEASSFQLERIKSFRPKVSVILNVTEDHLDRYKSWKEYLAAKKRIFENQRGNDIAILNCDDEILKYARKAWNVKCRLICFSRKEKSDLPDRIFNKSKLKGEHNIENILVCALMAELLGAKKDTVEKAVTSFEPLSHRFESIAGINGVEFIDDSKATNIDSTYRALKSLKRPAILIAGGKDKNLSYEKVLPALRERVKKMILIGETKPKMQDIFKSVIAVEEKDSLEEAVQAAYKSASPGDCVLLSPMSSSFDMFKDYKERGEAFREAVKEVCRKTENAVN